MSSQIQITGETKVKSLTGVLVGTTGVVSSLAFDVAGGVPKLDVNGKILVSQLPNSVMEYQGTWNATTNVPYLVNGVGNAGDVWLVSTGGVHDFGAGAITFVVSDQVIFSNVAEGSIWQKASGSNGTVTSVAITESGDSLNITGSPITTSGTINIGFNGTNLQYVNGAGNLTTFPILTGYVTAVSGTAPVVSSGGTTPAISMAAATSSVDGYLTSANFTTFNNKQNAITLTTTGTSGASTLIGATLNIPNYGSALSGYVPYTGATQDVDLGAFKLNAQSLHIKGTGGNGHLGLKHQSASATASANEVSLFADSLGDLSWLNGNLYLSKFITSGNTAARSYTFPNATCNIPNDSLVVHLAGTETITGAKTFSGYTTFTSTVDITSGLTFSNSGFTLVLQPPTLSVNRTVTLPNGTGTLALTSDIPSLIGYVPYTGATANVDLGSRSLTAYNIVITSNTSTYLSIWSTAASGNQWALNSSNNGNFYIAISGGSNAISISPSNKVDFGSTIGNGTYTYTLPSATGTIALTTDLGAYLPLAGGTLTGALFGTSATFSGTMVVGGTSTTQQFSVNGTTDTRAEVVSTSNSTAGVFFRVLSSGTKVASSTIRVTNSGILEFYNGGASETISLSIAANNAATFTSSVTATSFVKTSGTSSQFLKADGSVDSSTYLTTSAAASTYLPLAGGTLTGDLTINKNNSTDSIFKVQQSTNFYASAINLVAANDGGAGYNYINSSTNGGATHWQIGGGALANTMVLYTGGTPRLTLASTGAATFSSSVNIGTRTASPNRNLNIYAATNDNAIIKLDANDGNGYGAQIDYTSKTTGGTSNTWTLGTGVSQVANSFEFFNGTSATMALTIGGNVLIGTTTDSGYKLDVNGTGRFKGDMIVGQGSGSDVVIYINSQNGSQSQIRSNTGVSSSYNGMMISSNYNQANGLPSWSLDLGGALNSTTNVNAFTVGYKPYGGSWNSYLTIASTGAATFSIASGVYTAINITSPNTSVYYQLTPTGGDSYILGSGVAQTDDFAIYNATRSKNYLTILGGASGGNVGINFTNPGARFEVQEGTAVPFSGTGYRTAIFSSTSAANSDRPGVTLGWDSNGGGIIATATQAGTTNYLAFWTYNGAWGERLRIAKDGASTFTSSVTATGFFESSDSRLKTLIQDNYQTKGIASITPKLYTKNGKVELGYYAQDFVGILDSAVSKGSDDMLSLSYREVLVAKVYALEQEIKELKAKMN